MVMMVFGIKSPKAYTENDIKSEARKQGIKSEDLYVLDTSINEILSNSDTSKSVKSMIKTTVNQHRHYTIMKKEN